MATLTLKGTPVNTRGSLPQIGSIAPDFNLTKVDLSIVTLADFKNKTIVMNVFPSVDTETCATSVVNFNKHAAQLDNTVVLCISRDTPFALNRFACNNDINGVINLSDVRDGNFGINYQLDIIDGLLAGFHSRAVIVIDPTGKISYTEQVQEIANEPDYESALKSIK